MSAEANNFTVDLKAALDRNHTGEVGVPAGPELLAFTNAVELAGVTIDETRSALAAVIGAEGALEAAGIIAIFNGLVRVADGTGIELDQGVFAASVEERDLLGINSFAGAANSASVRLDADLATPTAVSQLFGQTPKLGPAPG